LNVAKFDVNLDSIPGEFLNGYEIVAEFEAHDFDNNKTFYTDSNGLDMQKRILNHREYYNFTEIWKDDLHPNHNQNISGNYYPINSAI
jgi:lysosomal alpha-mannosidase